MSKFIYFLLVCFFIVAPVAAIENGDTVYIDYDLQGGVNNPNNITSFVYDSRGDDKYSLLPPTKEGAEFLGWYTTISTPVASNYKREKISSYDKPSSGNKLKIHARWGVVSKKPQMDEAGCMLVHDAAELYGAVKLADSLSKKACIFIENDIVVNENVLKSDGSANSGDFYWWQPFRYLSGVIEGNGHTISGLYGNIGLIEYVSHDAYIQNLGIVDSYFSGDNAGAFVSTVNYGDFELKNVFSSATVVSTSGYVGGLIGYVDRYGDMCLDVAFAHSRNPLAYASTNTNFPVSIENSYCTGYLVGEKGGGLVGALDNISIKNSFYAGKIDVTKNFSGIGLQATKTCQILSADDVSFENVFYPEEFQNQGFEGTPASTTEFADGTILEKLKNGAKIPIWTQGDADAYPKLSGAYYNIAYNLNGGTNDDSNPNYYTPKQEVELLPASKENDVFEGWFTDSLFTDSAGNIPSTAEGNQRYFAKWKSWYSITYINDGDYGVGNSSNPKYRYADSATFVLKEPKGSGRTFEGWYTDSTFTTKVTELPQGNTEDIVLIGKWIGREITIIYELYGGTMGDSTNPEKVLNGEKIRFKNPTREGYVFKGWNYPVEGHTYLNSSFTAYSAKYDTIYIYAEWTLEPIKPSVDSSGCYLVTNAHEWYYFNSFTEVYLGEKPPTDACIKIMEDFAVNEDLSELEPNHSTYGYVAWNCLDFTGTLYGNGHTISGLVMHYYSNEKDSYNGLFLDGRHDGKNPVVSDLYIANFYYNAKLNKNKVLINSKGSGKSGISRMVTPAPLKQIRSPKYDIKGRSMKKHPNYGVFF